MALVTRTGGRPRTSETQMFNDMAYSDGCDTQKPMADHRREQSTTCCPRGRDNTRRKSPRCIAAGHRARLRLIRRCQAQLSRRKQHVLGIEPQS